MNRAILAVAAMDIEKELLLSKMIDVDTITLNNGAPLHVGSLGGRPFAILSCGVGKVNAAMGVALALREIPIDLVVNTGVAGGLLEKQVPGDIVVSSQVAYHDVDVCAFGYALGQLPGAPALFQGSDSDRDFLLKKGTELGFPIMDGVIVSGDYFVNKPEQTNSIIKNFPNAACVEMEAAAVAHAAFAAGIPFVIIRALSDKADGKSKSDYQSFVEIAANRAARLTEALVNA